MDDMDLTGGREQPTSMQDVLQSAKAETAQVKRIVLSCERDMEAQKSGSRKGIYTHLYNYCIIILHVNHVIALFGFVWDHVWDV